MKISADNSAVSDQKLQKQAWVWLRQLNSGDVKPWDAKAFQRWLAASPAHKAAFNDAKRRWEALGQAGHELVRSDPGMAASHARLRHARTGDGRRMFLGAAVSAAAVTGVALTFAPAGLLPSGVGWRADDRTATGEQRTLDFGHRILVTLNTQTSIRRKMQAGQAVGIDLLAGEAAIDLPPGSRPFEVMAGSGSSSSGIGHFDVRYLNGKVCVTCIDGEVCVQHPAGRRILQARQQTVYDDSAISGIAAVSTAAVSAWRNGELLFTQARLKDVIDDINRYRHGRVVLMNDAAGGKLVSGSFSIASLDVALLQLQQTFDLQARSLPGGLYILS